MGWKDGKEGGEEEEGEFEVKEKEEIFYRAFEYVERGMYTVPKECLVEKKRKRGKEKKGRERG